MNKVVMDTSIIIDHLRGLTVATEYLRGLEKGSLHGVISTITYVELFAGERITDQELARIEMLLSLLETVDVRPDVARQAGLLLSKYRRSHGLTPFDALIAATALSLEIPLATRNLKDFDFIPDLDVSNPY